MGINDWDNATRAPIPGSRTPGLWGPLGQIPLKAAAIPIPLGGVKPGRAAFMISNIGANPILIRAAQTDNSPYFTLPTWSYIIIGTEGEIWISSPSGSTADVVELSYELSGHGVYPPGQFQAPSIAGAV